MFIVFIHLLTWSNKNYTVCTSWIFSDVSISSRDLLDFAEHFPLFWEWANFKLWTLCWKMDMSTDPSLNMLQLRISSYWILVKSVDSSLETPLIRSSGIHVSDILIPFFWSIFCSPLKPDYSILFIFITFYYNFSLFFHDKMTKYLTVSFYWS